MPNWDEIRKEFESSKITLAALAEKHDIKLGTLKSRKSREGWSRGSPKKDATKTEKVATKNEKVATVEKNKIDDPDLTEKQKRFVEEYIVDLNATQAAIRAGYSKKTAQEQGSRLLSNVKVLAHIKRLREEQKEKLFLDSLWVLERLTQVVDRAMQAEPVMTYDYGTQELVETGEYQFDSVGANKALELIGKHLMMFDPKARHTEEITRAQIEKIRAETEKIKAEAERALKENTDDESEEIVIVDEWSDDDDN